MTGLLFEKSPVSAFALQRLIIQIFGSLLFAITGHISLYSVLGIMFVTCMFSAITFVLVDKKYMRCIERLKT